MQRTSILFRVLPVVLATSVLLTGCGKETGPTVEALQTENANLKAQLETLQSQCAANQSVNALSAESHHALFTDLDKEQQTTAFINELTQLGVFDDLGEQFNPYQPITRAEYVTWLFNAHNAITKGTDKIQLAPAYDPGFTDLSKDHPAYKYVASLANAGYSVGYDDHTFKPDQPLTREEMIVIKVGVDSGKTFKPDYSMMSYVWKFSDGKSVDSRYTGYIHEDYMLNTFSNIKRAYGTIGTFKPQAPVLRHEAASTLWAFKKYPGISDTTATKALERANETT